jgi:hypothetical protein
VRTSPAIWPERRCRSKDSQLWMWIGSFQVTAHPGAATQVRFIAAYRPAQQWPKLHPPGNEPGATSGAPQIMADDRLDFGFRLLRLAEVAPLLRGRELA